MKTVGSAERMRERETTRWRHTVKHQLNIIFVSVMVNRQTVEPLCEGIQGIYPHQVLIVKEGIYFEGIYPHHVLTVKENKEVLPNVSSLSSSDK